MRTPAEREKERRLQMNTTPENDEYYYDSVLSRKITKIIEREVQSRLSTKQRQLEEDNKYLTEERFKILAEKRKLECLKRDYEVLSKKNIEEAVKQAQREYWFDCAIGDTVYIVKSIKTRQNCPKVHTKDYYNNYIKVEIEGVEVDAKCPICGTKELREKNLPETVHYEIVKRHVKRLAMEFSATHKWISIDTSEEGAAFVVVPRGSFEVFRTKEEAERYVESVSN